MRLSIVVPFYNEFEFVADAVNSVLGQAMEGVEVVIVNDNPAGDGTAWLKRRFDQPEVRVVEMPQNGGLSAARNFGVRNATGAYIGFLDSDDYVLADGLFRQLAHAEATGADMVHGQTMIAQPGQLRGMLAGSDKGHLSRRALLTGEERFTPGFRIFTSWASLYRRELFERGLAFDEDQRRWEDRLFVVDAIKAAQSLAVLAEPVRFWRKRGGSIMTSAPGIEDCRLKAQNFEKCTPKWFDADVAEPGFWAAREFLRDVKTMLLHRDSMPWARFFCEDAEIRPLEDRMMAAASGWGITAENLEKAMALDPYIFRKNGSALYAEPGECTGMALALIRGDRTTAEGIVGKVTGRGGQGPAAPAILRGTAPLMGVRVSLHVGLHKTGSTFLQKTLSANREKLLSTGVLFPETGLGFFEGVRAVREGGLPGHQRLLRSILGGTGDEVQKLAEEVRETGARHVLISAENLSMPQASPELRASKIRQFCAALADPSDVRVLAVYRRPDIWMDSYYREVVTNGFGGAHQSFHEFWQNNRHLTNLAGMFLPVERALGRKLALVDYDRSVAADSLLADIFRAAELPDGLAASLTVPTTRVYPSLSNAQVNIARLLSIMEPEYARRGDLLRGYFGMTTAAGEKRPFATPAERRTMLAEFVGASKAFVAERAVNLGARGLDLADYTVEEDGGGDRQDVSVAHLEAYRSVLLMREAAVPAEEEPTRIVRRKNRLKRLLGKLRIVR